jgi:hypothetical protein
MIQPYPMKAKRLEAILASEGHRSAAEMVTRFQQLRNFRMLPTSRGRNAEDIAVDGVVSGLLGMISEAPGFAGVKTIVLRGLRPVGGIEQSFARAETFSAAFRAALEDEKLLDTVLEIRLTDDEIYTNSNGRAVIVYWADGVERVAYYVGHTAVSLLGPGGERHFNPREYNSAILREMIIQPRLLKRIMREYRESERWEKMKDDIQKHYQGGDNP